MRWSLNLLLLPFWCCSRPFLSWKSFGNIVRIMIRHIVVKQIPKKNDYFVRNYKDFKVEKYIDTILSLKVSVPPNMDMFSYLILDRKLFPCCLERILNVEDCWNEWLVFRNSEIVPELKFSFTWQKVCSRLNPEATESSETHPCISQLPGESS